MADKNIKTKVQFEEAASRQSLNTNDSVPSLFGKIKKWLSDLKAVAFSGSYNDLTDKPTIPTVTNDLTDTLKDEYDTAYENNHTHDNKSTLDNTTASFTTDLKNKLDGIESGANAYVLPNANTTTLGGIKPDGTTIVVDENGVASSVGGSSGGFAVGDEIITERTLDNTWHKCDGSFLNATSYSDLSTVLPNRVYSVNKWVDKSFYDCIMKIVYGDGIWVAISCYNVIYWTDNIQNGSWNLCGNPSLQTATTSDMNNTKLDLVWSGSYWYCLTGTNFPYNPVAYATTANLKVNNWSGSSGSLTRFCCGKKNGTQDYFVGCQSMNLLYTTNAFLGTLTNISLSYLSSGYIRMVKYIDGYWFIFINKSSNADMLGGLGYRIFVSSDVDITSYNYWKQIGYGLNVFHINNRWYITGENGGQSSYYANYFEYTEVLPTDGTASWKSSSSGGAGEGITDIKHIGDYYYLFGNTTMYKFSNLEQGASPIEQVNYKNLIGYNCSMYCPEVVTDNNGNYLIYSTYRGSTLPSFGFSNNKVGLFFSDSKIKLPNNEGSIKIT